MCPSSHQTIWSARDGQEDQPGTSADQQSGPKQHGMHWGSLKCMDCFLGHFIWNAWFFRIVTILGSGWHGTTTTYVSGRQPNDRRVGVAQALAGLENPTGRVNPSHLRRTAPHRTRFLSEKSQLRELPHTTTRKAKEVRLLSSSKVASATPPAHGRTDGWRSGLGGRPLICRVWREPARLRRHFSFRAEESIPAICQRLPKKKPKTASRKWSI